MGVIPGRGGQVASVNGSKPGNQFAVELIAGYGGQSDFM